MDKAHKAMIFEWLRWILVLPGSIVCAILIWFPIHWAVIMIDKPNPLAFIPPKMLERFVGAFFGFYGFSHCGSENCSKIQISDWHSNSNPLGDTMWL